MLNGTVWVSTSTPSRPCRRVTRRILAMLPLERTTTPQTTQHLHVCYPAPHAAVPHTAVHPSQALACGGEVQLGEHAAEAVALAARAAGHGGGGDTSLGVGAPARASPLGSCGSGGRALPPPRCSTLFAWQHAVSPHLAVQLEGGPRGRVGGVGRLQSC